MKKREFNDFYAQSMEIYNRCQREIIDIMIEKGVDSVNIHENNVDDACYLAHCNFNGDWETSRIEEIKFKGEYIQLKDDYGCDLPLCDFTNDAVYIIYEYVYESLIGYDNEQE